MKEHKTKSLILNSPYEEPKEHWRYNRERRKFSRDQGRRQAGYLVATPNVLGFDDPGVFVPISLANEIRGRVYPDGGEKDGRSRLACNLRAEVDEDLIEAYRGLESLPFEAGQHRRVAVKIVDDRGVESLRVLEVE